MPNDLLSRPEQDLLASNIDNEKQHATAARAQPWRVEDAGDGVAVESRRAARGAASQPVRCAHSQVSAAFAETKMAVLDFQAARFICVLSRKDCTISAIRSRAP